MTATTSKTILNFPTPVADAESMPHLGGDGPEMSNQPMANERSLRERAMTEKFLETRTRIRLLTCSRPLRRNSPPFLNGCSRSHALCRHYGKQWREVDTVDLAGVPDRSVAASHKPAATPAFEFMHWMASLDSREREVMKLRFIKQWEHHEIAAAQAIPIGTVQWRVFNAKKKLAPYLTTRQNITRKAA
jgi:DNA-directed RNA polymerase specialized sigma24 family protein